jgi:plastocyanin
MRALILKGTLVVALAGAMLATSGCRYDDRPADRRAAAVTPYDGVKMKIEPSRERAVVGEVVTFTAMTEDLLGRDAEIRWTAPAGELREEQEGRVARVIFDEPGTYSVTARLFIDGHEVRRDTRNITVQPVR